MENKIDYIVCSKNRSDKLEHIIEQILKEKTLNKLIVVAGDFNTLDIAKKYTPYVYYDEDRGLGYARKLGVLKATTDIIAFVDDDVILTENCVEKLMQCLKDNIIAVTAQRFIRDNVLERIRYGCYMTLFKRDKLLEIGNFDMEIKDACEDMELYIRTKKMGYDWIVTNDVMVLHPLTVEEWKKHIEWYNNSVKKVYKYMFKKYGVETIDMFKQEGTFQ